MTSGLIFRYFCLFLLRGGGVIYTTKSRSEKKKQRFFFIHFYSKVTNFCFKKATVFSKIKQYKTARRCDRNYLQYLEGKITDLVYNYKHD